MDRGSCSGAEECRGSWTNGPCFVATSSSNRGGPCLPLNPLAGYEGPAGQSFNKFQPSLGNYKTLYQV